MEENAVTNRGVSGVTDSDINSETSEALVVRLAGRPRVF
jgi:hypothetical protein